MQQIYTPKINYKVQARSLTYNQAKYIEDALNGFAIQQTNFPFVCLVIDDCSTDGEQEVIKAWMERECDMDKAEYVEIEPSHIILVPHRTNKSCSFAFYLLKKNLYKEKQKKQDLIKPWRDHCEYEALCEGDDYWTDPLKLQKQVDIMDNNPECSIVLSNGILLHEGSGAKEVINPIGDNVPSSFISIEQMLIEQNYLIPTASMCYRSDIYMKMPDFLKKCPVGDKPLRTWMALNGKVYYFNDTMVTYRSGAVGSFSFWSGRKKGYAEKLYKGMHEYYNALNEYTEHRYDKLIKYLDDKEEFFYYKRVDKLLKMMNCAFYKQLSKEEQKKEVKGLVTAYIRHKGRVLLTKLHLNWLYPKR